MRKGRIRRVFQNFLKKLGESNEQSFGDKRMDCCDLNKEKHEKHRDNSH
jgi:hypothetical protein